MPSVNMRLVDSVGQFVAYALELTLPDVSPYSLPLSALPLALASPFSVFLALALASPGLPGLRFSFGLVVRSRSCFCVFGDRGQN